MSLLEVDSLVDKEGTGSPSFPNGTKADLITESTSNNGVQVQGKTDGNTVSTGNRGEVLESAVSGVSTINGTASDMQSLSVTAGIWYLEGFVRINRGAFTATGATNIVSSLSETSATQTSTFHNLGKIQYSTIAGTDFEHTMHCTRIINISSTTTYYLVGSTSSGANTVGFGEAYIRARRIK